MSDYRFLGCWAHQQASLELESHGAPNAKRDRAEVCSNEVDMKSALIAFGISFPIGLYLKKSWPLMLGFVLGSAHDMWKWQQCVNAPQEVIDERLKKLEQSKSGIDPALAAKVSKDIIEYEKQNLSQPTSSKPDQKAL